MQSGQAFQANGGKCFSEAYRETEGIDMPKKISEETLVALKTNNAIKDAQGTITFLGKIINFWKIVNCKGIYADVRSRDPIRSPVDPRLD